MNPASVFHIKNKAFQMLINVIIIIVIILLIYWLYNKFADKFATFKRNKAIEKDLSHIVNQQGSDPDAHVSGNVRTYTDADYKLMAEALFEAMDGPGTDENAILTILGSLRTKADWFALNDAYGIRKTTSPWSSFEGNLTKWLADELDGYFDNDTKAQVNNILSKFGVGRI